MNVYGLILLVLVLLVAGTAAAIYRYDPAPPPIFPESIGDKVIRAAGCVFLAIWLLGAVASIPSIFIGSFDPDDTSVGRLPY